MRINSIDDLPPRFKSQVEEQTGKKKVSKYKNIKTQADGIKFDSTKEAERYGELRLLEKAGEICFLGIQIPFSLAGGVVYKADFVYYDKVNKYWVVEDVKGYRTQEYKIKKKLMADIGIEIKEQI